MTEITVEPNVENLGIPDIEADGLKIWTHSRKYPESKRFWDVNWLNSTFHCSVSGASVWVSGDIIHNTEIEDWLVEIEKSDKSLLSEISLKTMERHINVKISSQTYQRISIKVDIEPDRVFQKHYFEFWLDQNSLKDLIASCRNILTKFPILARETGNSIKPGVRTPGTN